MKGIATIQVQDVSGNWRSITTVIKQDQVIKVNINFVARQFKNSRFGRLTKTATFSSRVGDLSLDSLCGTRCAVARSWCVRHQPRPTGWCAAMSRMMPGFTPIR